MFTEQRNADRETVVVTILHERIEVGHETTKLREELERCMNEQEFRQVVINFSKVTDWTPPNLEALVFLYRRLVQVLGGRLLLTDMNPRVLEAFENSPYASMFDIYEHEHDALQLLGV